MLNNENLTLNLKENLSHRRLTSIQKTDNQSVNSYNSKTKGNPMYNKKLAFTLAEVLITLGIIGVVAALTIPSLIANYQKKVIVNRLKQTSSMISQGFKLYMADEGISDLSGDLDWKTDKNALNTLFKKYFKVARDCNGKYYPCSASEYYSLTKNNHHVMSDSSFNAFCQLTIVLLNGAFVCADPSTDSSTEYIIWFEVDVNGSAGPNKYGVDYITFQIDKNGNIFDTYYKENGFSYNGKWPDNGAYGKIVADGWKMNY
jgi:prepilin-type N-terminal cleavage/methylation domain-containing protein